MDKSEKYIEMCKKAVEIQDSYHYQPPSYDDIFVGKVYHGIELFGHLTPTNMPITNDYIWLPRQDQLQEMVSLKEISSDFDVDEKYLITTKNMVKMENFNRFFEWYYKTFDSFEQFWLAFVMLKKYKKIWNGTDWQPK